MLTDACKCGQKYQIPASTMGKKVKCPNCGEVVVVHAPSQPSSPVPPPIIPAAQVELVQQPPQLQPQTFATDFPQQSTNQTQLPLGHGRIYKASKKKKRFPVIASSVIGAVLLIGLGVCAMIVVSQSKGQLKTVATNVARTTVDNKEAEKVAQQLITGYESPNSNETAKLIDFGELLDRSIVGLNLPAKDRKDALRGMKSNASASRLHQQVHQVAKDGFNAVLKVRKIEGETRALCRFFSADQGVVYMDFIFYKDKAGQVKVADIDFISTGERMSQSMRRVFMELAKSVNRNVIQKLTGADNAMTKNIEKVVQMQTMMRNNSSEAMKMYKRLPKELRLRKNFMLIRIQIASELGDDEYLAALEAFQQRYKNHPAALLQSIDYYLLKEDYAKSIESMEKLNKQVGGDPALKAMAASIYHIQGDSARAIQDLEEVIATDSGFQPAYQDLIGIAFDNQNHEMIYRHIVQFQNQFPDTELELQDYLNFDSFRRSSYYQKWISGSRGNH